MHFHDDDAADDDDDNNGIGDDNDYDCVGIVPLVLSTLLELGRLRLLLDLAEGKLGKGMGSTIE